MLGIGMRWNSLEELIDHVHHRRRKKILDILKNHKINLLKNERNPNFGNRLLRCNNCNGLYQAFYVKILYDDDKIYETRFKCPQCKKELQEIKNENLEKYPCPECGMKKLEINDTIMWD
jgi:DNA-directed RNA polymerase subunit RPC12/RpoP